MMVILHVAQGACRAVHECPATLTACAASTYRDIASQFKTNTKQVHEIVFRVMSAINTAMAPQFMSWGSRPVIAARRLLCEQKCGVDGIVGFIDCTHLHIRVSTAIEHVEAVSWKG